jgi:exosome complex exonuclease RRP6
MKDDQPAGVPEQIEVPYVPAAQRQQKNIVDDSIVVVGQARQKKRKRVKSSAHDTDPGSAAVPVMNAETSAEARQTEALKRKGQRSSTPQESFDYSAVPNILDDVPTPERDSTSRKKKKQNKGKARARLRCYRPTAHLSQVVV